MTVLNRYRLFDKKSMTGDVAMNTPEPLLKIRFDGKAVGPGKISVSHLLRFLPNLNKVLQRAGRVLQGERDSSRQGRPPQNIKVEVALDLVLLTEGSPSAVLGFERRQYAPSFPQMDFGLEILESAISGLEDIQKVRIIGEAREDPLTGKIASIKIHDVERLDDRDDEAADLLPLGTPVTRNFWESPSLEELALSQNVHPLKDVRKIFGTWPGEDNDGFENAIDILRHHVVYGGYSQLQ